MTPRLGPAGSLGAAVLLVSMLAVAAEAGPDETQSSTSSILVGTRIRFHAPSVVNGRVEGIVIEKDSESLLVGINDRVPLRVSRQAITQLDVSMGRHRPVLKGALIGAAIGMTCSAITLGSDSSSTSGDIAAGIGLGAVGGAVWGAGIGALFKTDSWSSVPLERIQVGLGPTRGRGVALKVSVGF